jgi:hypothetical protein
MKAIENNAAQWCRHSGIITKSIRRRNSTFTPEPRSTKTSSGASGGKVLRVDHAKTLAKRLRFSAVAFSSSVGAGIAAAFTPVISPTRDSTGESKMTKMSCDHPRILS